MCVFSCPVQHWHSTWPRLPCAGAFCFFCAASLQRSLWKNSERSAMFYFREKGRSVLKAIRVCREVPEIGRTACERKRNQQTNCVKTRIV